MEGGIFGASSLFFHETQLKFDDPSEFVMPSLFWLFKFKKIG
jgi:hypothetical protein